MTRLATCRNCNRPVLWTVTEHNKRQAIDPTPVPPEQAKRGDVAVQRDHTGTWRSRVPTPDRPRAAHEKMHVPHAATCTRRLPVAEPATLPAGVVSLDAARRRRRTSRHGRR